MTNKSSIYTRGGDSGETSLFGGKRVKKSDQRIITLGTIDELNALLGLINSQLKSKRLIEHLEEIQERLFEIGAEIAKPASISTSIKSKEFDETKVVNLEKLIDQQDSKLPNLRNFILPGGSSEASLLHYARTVCRRAERELTKLSQNEGVDFVFNKYLNRLSDLLFVFARAVNKSSGKSEKIWKGR